MTIKNYKANEALMRKNIKRRNRVNEGQSYIRHVLHQYQADAEPKKNKLIDCTKKIIRHHILNNYKPNIQK